MPKSKATLIKQITSKLKNLQPEQTAQIFKLTQALRNRDSFVAQAIDEKGRRWAVAVLPAPDLPSN